ncbi:MAG: hypothetical protein CM15mP84_03610 [Cellvibrionales bacterium]|nr:MAG: hypothetical protein CM15mP84_03610 [Cellvibrionales bacterium]
MGRSDNGWQARYEILPGKEKVVSELKKLAKTATLSIWQPIWTERERRSPGIFRKPLAVIRAAIIEWSLTKFTQKAIQAAFEAPASSILRVYMRSRRDVSGSRCRL